MIRASVSQSVADHQGRLGLGISVEGARSIVNGRWSESVEGRQTSQPLTIGRRRGLAKVRSITKGRALPTKRNLVYSPGGLRRAKPPFAAFSKHGVEEPISRGENNRSGSERGLCMLMSPTTRRGTPRDGKRISGESEWTRWSRVLVE